MLRSADDRGQVLPLLALLMLVAGFVAYGLALLGAIAVGQARVQTAADAVALAVAAHPEDGVVADRAVAERVAQANGAHVVRVERLGTDVRVVVALRVLPGRWDVHASARARPAELGM